MVTLENKAVVVTGAGRGLGRAYAMASAAAGAAVVVNDLESEPAHSVAAEIVAGGGRAVAHVADISNNEEAIGLIDHCVEEFGAIDGLVNNAGYGMIDTSAPESQDVDELRRVFEVNVFGTAYCGMAAMRHMLDQGAGSIVNDTSAAMAGTQQLGAYSASKGAVASLTLSWAVDLKATAVRVNGVSPMAITRAWDWKLVPDRSAVPRADLLKPEDNAGMVVFLLSDEAASVHGQLITLRGGDLSIISHPAAVEPVLSREEWSADVVASAFGSELAGVLQPLGMGRVRIEHVD